MSVTSFVHTSLTSLVCSGCGAGSQPARPGWRADATSTRPFRCPNAGRDDADHVLRRRLVPDGAASELRAAFIDPEPDPFIRYRRLTHTWQSAITAGISDDEYVDVVAALERRIAAIDGTSFHVTPFLRRNGVWIKDETGNVGGSHKGRHLMGLMLWIELMKRFDPTLA